MTRRVRITSFVTTFIVFSVSIAFADFVDMSLTSTSSGDLTAQGGLDWSVFGTSTFTNTPGAGIDDFKDVLPAIIGPVSSVNGNSLFDFANFSAAPEFTWTDGKINAVSSGTPAMMVIRPTGQGDGFSFSVAAAAGVPQKLTVYTQAFRGTATMTASLNGTMESSSYTAGASDVPGVFTIVYQAMTTGKLDINFLSSSVSGTSPSIGIGAIALSAVPEPSSFLLLGLVFGIGLCLKKLRNTKVD